MSSIPFLSDQEYGDSQLLSVGLALPLDQAQTIIDISEKINDLDPLQYHLNLKKNPPFVRLYECALPLKNLTLAHQKLQQLAHDMVPMHLKWGEVETSPHSLLLWGEIEPALKVFQEAVMVTLNPLREGYFKQKYAPQASYLSNLEKLSVERWGWPWANDYHPYVVIAKPQTLFKSNDFEIDWPFQKYVAQKLYVSHKTGPGIHQEISYFPFTQTIVLDEPEL